MHHHRGKRRIWLALLGALVTLAPDGVAGPQDVQPPATEDPKPTVEESKVVEEPGTQEAQAEEPQVEEPKQSEKELAVHGSLQAWYRYRKSSGESDNDFYTNLNLDVGDDQVNPFTFHFSGNFTADLDDMAQGGDVYFGLGDAQGGSTYANLYEVYFDVNAVKELDELRVGRQMLYVTPYFTWFDGALLESTELTESGLKLGTYGGRRVYGLDEASDNDGLFGAYATARPWEHARMRFDYQYLQGGSELGELANNLYSLELYQGLWESLNLYGSYSWIDEDGHDFRLRGTYNDVETNLMVQLSYYQLLQTQAELAPEINPFFSSLLEHLPYQLAQLLVSKALTEKVFLQAGSDIRWMTEDDPGEFNREFERYYLTFSLRDFPSDYVRLDLTGELWDQNGDDIESWGAVLTKTFNERWEAALRSYFSLYKYDLYNNSEQNNVQTYALDIDYDYNSSLKFSVRYGYEDDQIDDYQLLRLMAYWSF